MKSFLILTLCLFLGSVSFADRSSPLFREFPLTHHVQLQGGESIPMPFQIYDGEATLLIGTADIHSLSAMLKGNNVYPARLSSDKGLMGIYIIHYSDTVIGTYDEAFVTVLVNYQKPTENDIFQNYLDIVKVFIPELSSADLEKRNLGFYAWKLWVSSDLSMRAGREIWGYNKTLASIKLDSGLFSTNIGLADVEGPLFSLSLNSILIPLMYTFPLRMDFLSTTPVEIKQTTGRAIIQADASIRALVGNTTIQFNPKHSWGKTLSKINFEPMAWIQAKNPSAIIFDPFKGSVTQQFLSNSVAP